MFSFFKKFFDPSRAQIKSAQPIVDEILALEPEVAAMSTQQMSEKISSIRQGLAPFLDKIDSEQHVSLKTVKADQMSADELALHAELIKNMPLVFALMRELNKRKFNKPHYPVQLLASVILAHGYRLTELKTGEGKTQVFHLPAALYGLTSRGSHVITVNDYLARRDGEYAGHAMADLGISVGIITPQASYRFVPDDQLEATKGAEAAAERKEIDIALMGDMKGINLIEVSKEEAYKQDVVYATNNELGFDYLRDNMVFNLNKKAQGELYFCLVDEADSILIDEARTPLIISSPAGKSNDLYDKFAGIVKQLSAEKHYTVDEKSHSANLTEDGVEYVQKLVGSDNLWENYELAHHINNALKASTLYKLDEEYIIRNGEVMIVDEFTGRVLEGRRYSDGLHQALEAKESVEIKRESRTMATITFQNFFKLYKFISGGSGTVLTESEEFMSIYNLEAIEIPTHRPIAREDKGDKVYKNKLVKFNAVADEIEAIHTQGQPVLIGTTSIEASEYLSRLLSKRGIVHEVLNAKHHERESAIVANAGLKGSVTVATNMAGRGTDIVLGKGVKELGGLYIIGTERHDSRRIDNQLRGRAGRQGDPGTSQFFVALDDEIMRVQGGEVMQRILGMVKFIPDDFPIENGMIGSNITRVQKKMEGHHFDVRKRLVEYDGVVNQQREIYYARRHNVLTLAENATKDKTLYPQIEEQLKEYLENEVEFIVNRHYLADRSDSSDLSSAVKEFIDIASGDEINRVMTISSQDTVNWLLQELKGKSQTEVLGYLHELTNKVLISKIADFGESLPELFKITCLQSMDNLWTEHLSAMTDLRDGIGLRGYAQKNPLIEYKNEGFMLFEQFIASSQSQIARRILKIQRVTNTSSNVPLQTNADAVSDILTGTREMSIDSAPASRGAARVISRPKTIVNATSTKRNDVCPCGSGLKYKKCGMINAPQHKA